MSDPAERKAERVRPGRGLRDQLGLKPWGHQPAAEWPVDQCCSWGAVLGRLYEHGHPRMKLLPAMSAGASLQFAASLIGRRPPLVSHAFIQSAWQMKLACFWQPAQRARSG